MRVGTLVCVAGFVLAVIALVLSMVGVSSDRGEGYPREYSFTCWGAAKEVKELQKGVVDKINEGNKDFRVTLIPIPDYPTKLCTMIAGGTPPDFFYLSQEYIPAFAAQGALLDLTELIENDKDEVTDLKSYYPNILDLYRYQGRVYGLPWIAQPIILYCNAKLFRDSGVPLPDRSWDWETFVEAGKALTRDTNGDGRIDQWGFVLYDWPPYQIWIWQNGGEIVEPESRRVALDDAKVIGAMDFYAGLIHKHRIAPPLGVTVEGGGDAMFKSGKVAMFMGGAEDDLESIEGLEVVAAELPQGPTGIRATFAWTGGLHISRSVSDPEQAFEVWKQILERIHEWKIPAPRRSLAARLEEFEPRKAHAADVIRASMEYMRTPVIFERHVEWDTLFREEFQDEILRRGTPAAEMVRRTKGMFQGFR